MNHIEGLRAKVAAHLDDCSSDCLQLTKTGTWPTSCVTLEIIREAADKLGVPFSSAMSIIQAMVASEALQFVVKQWG